MTNLDHLFGNVMEQVKNIYPSKHEKLLNTWLDSIIEREIDHVINVFEGDENGKDENYFQEECYELWWKAQGTFDEDSGDHWTAPCSEMTEIQIDFTLKIYRADDTFGIEKYYTKQITL